MLRILVVSVLSLVLVLGCTEKKEQKEAGKATESKIEISQPAPPLTDEPIPPVEQAQENVDQAAQVSHEAKARLEVLGEQALILAEEAESVTKEVSRVTQQVEDLNQRLDQVAAEIETVLTQAETAMNQIGKARETLLQSTNELACKTGQPAAKETVEEEPEIEAISE